MKDKRTLIRAPALVVTVAATLLLVTGTYVVVAGSTLSVEPTLGLRSDPSNAVAWDSPWVPINQDQVLTLTHNLGGNPDNYSVEMWFMDTNGSLGVNRRAYGGLEANGDWYGAHWQNLTANTIRVYRQPDDNVADQIRLRVWIPPAPPDYASPWTNINPGQTIAFAHSLGITATDLTVGLWFSSTDRGINHFAYGGLSVDAITRTLGAYWHDLTNNAVQVTRFPLDTQVEQVRVVVVHGALPHYDSLEALGGWQSVAPGSMFTFTHNLHWDPNLLLVRGECYTSTVGTGVIPGGIHQGFAGGDHHWSAGWRGANLQNLTDSTVAVTRFANDQVCPQFRVRVWKRGVQVYLPMVMNNYSAP